MKVNKPVCLDAYSELVAVHNGTSDTRAGGGAVVVKECILDTCSGLQDCNSAGLETASRGAAENSPGYCRS